MPAREPLLLRIQPPDGEAFTRPVGEAGLVLGRSSDCNVRLFDDESLSRRHCRIWLEDGEVWVEDLGSRNGTFLADAPVKARTRLRPGQRVTAGATSLSLVQAAEDEDEPSGRLHDTTAIIDVTSLSGKVQPRNLFGDLKTENRALALLSRAGAELISHRPLAEVLEAVLDLTIEGVDAERAAVALIDQDGDDAPPRIAASRGKDGAIDIRVSRTVTRQVVEQRRAVAITDVQGDPNVSIAESVRLQGVRSLMCAPLWDGSRVQGVLYADRRLGRGSYAEADLKVLSLLANVLAVKIENARLIERALEATRLEEELGVARRIQERLLPSTPPAIAEIDVHGACLSCEEIGGDFFDWVALPQARLGLAVADVCGKGVAGALLAASVQSALRGGRVLAATPADRLAWLNDFVVEHAATERFITAAWVEIDPATGRLEHSVAGHHPPLVLPPHGAMRMLRQGGLPLGLFAGSRYEQGHDRLEPGTKLVLYTDGIVEASPRGDRTTAFGVQRLAEAILAAPPDAKACCAAALSALSDFTGAAPLRDDATLLVAVIR